MVNSLPLLEQPHDVAVRTILTQALKPGVNANYLIAGVSQLGADGSMALPVYITSEAYTDLTWKYSGGATISYERVDLQTALGPLNLRFHVPSTFTTDDIAAKITAVLGLFFEPGDFQFETRSFTGFTTEFTLAAAFGSVRWKGQVKIRLYQGPIATFS